MSRPKPPRLFHYTCADHGDQGIREDGFLMPVTHIGLGRPLVWLTDLDVPMRQALGLTSALISCDRTQIRYEIPVATSAVIWWPDWARAKAKYIPAGVRADLERYGMPAHWWVSEVIVQVIDRADLRTAA